MLNQLSKQNTLTKNSTIFKLRIIYDLIVVFNLGGVDLHHFYSRLGYYQCRGVERAKIRSSQVVMQCWKPYEQEKFERK